MSFKVFRKRREVSYHTWREEGEDEEFLPQQDDIARQVSDEERPRFLLGSDSPDGRTFLYGATGDEEILLDCFYLGSYDMTGRSVKGRGCIDEPAGTIWKQTQETSTDSFGVPTRRGSGSRPRRKNSLPSNTLHFCRPKYVRLVAGTEDLKVVDNHTDEVLVSYSYRWISFTGTHPKYSRMFCFVAWEPKCKTPYCHAFKCEDVTSARSTAVKLSSIFKQKCQEILGKGNEHVVASSGTVCPMPRPVLRKSMSVQHCQWLWHDYIIVQWTIAQFSTTYSLSLSIHTLTSIVMIIMYVLSVQFVTCTLFIHVFLTSVLDHHCTHKQYTYKVWQNNNCVYFILIIINNNDSLSF